MGLDVELSGTAARLILILDCLGRKRKNAGSRFCMMGVSSVAMAYYFAVYVTAPRRSLTPIRNTERAAREQPSLGNAGGVMSR